MIVHLYGSSLCLVLPCKQKEQDFNPVQHLLEELMRKL